MKNSNMPAMPLSAPIDISIPWDELTAGGRFLPANGLTKREIIAMSAMQGLLSNSGGVVQSNSMSGTGFCNSDEKSLAAWSVACADALLEALENE